MANDPAGYTPKDVEAVVDDKPVVTKPKPSVGRIAEYYMYPLGDGKYCYAFRYEAG